MSHLEETFKMQHICLRKLLLSLKLVSKYARGKNRQKKLKLTFVNLLHQETKKQLCQIDHDLAFLITYSDSDYRCKLDYPISRPHNVLHYIVVLGYYKTGFGFVSPLHMLCCMLNIRSM